MNEKKCINLVSENMPLTHCPNIECIYEGMDSETWKCEVCGEHFKLYYEDMQ